MFLRNRKLQSPELRLRINDKNPYTGDSRQKSPGLRLPSMMGITNNSDQRLCCNLDKYGTVKSKDVSILNQECDCHNIPDCS